MRIEILRDVCESNGYCEAVAPQVFHLNDDDVLEVADTVPADAEDAVRRAAKSCPKQAIRLHE